MTPGIVGESDLAGNTTSEYIFFGGERVARRDLTVTALAGSTPIYSTVGISYYFSDSLKTASVITDPVGNIKAESDYYPWGGELQFVNNDPNHYKFTGKERDSETGLDYFGARYYSNGMGRWTSIDPVLVTPARMFDPQRFNLYNYGRDNPLKYVDPDGRDINLVNDTAEGRKAALATITKNMTEKEAGNIDARQNKDGKWEVYVKDTKAISSKDASVGYKGVTSLIGDHSIVANVGLIGGSSNFTATYSDLGKVSSWSGGAMVLQPPPGSKNVSVVVTQGDLPGGVQVVCCNGNGVYQGVAPDFVNMYHELVGETLKYRAGNESLQNDIARDSRTVIKIENEIREFHQMNPRTGADHGQPVITVTPK
jgi:RHS repeat-associated protein